MKSPFQLSDKELNSYSDGHLKYELDMLIWSAGILATLGTVSDKGLLPWAINNSVLESFAIHARNLVDFLYARSRNKDRKSDLVIEDYIDTETLAKVMPKITPLLEQAITKSNKQVAHLTIERIDYEREGKAWSFIDVAREILAVFQLLAPYFPEEKTGASFRELISNSQMTVPFVRSLVVSDFQNTDGVEFLIQHLSPQGN